MTSIISTSESSASLDTNGDDDNGTIGSIANDVFGSIFFNAIYFFQLQHFLFVNGFVNDFDYIDI